MGDNFFFNWFGKSVDELKVIREKGGLTKEQLEKLNELIAKKENESK